MRPIDVFISYKRENRAAAEPLARMLADKGFRVWWDVDLLSGDNFIIEIFEVLKLAKAAVVLWSHEALQSRFVIGEALFAVNRDIYIGASLVPGIELPPPFNTLQYSDVSAWESRPAVLASIVPAIARKVALRTDVAKTPPVPSDELLAGAAAEAALWRDIAESDQVDGYRRYLDRYGKDGIFSELARSRIVARDKAQSQSTAGQPASRALPSTIEVPAGSFLMGSAADEPESEMDERPIRRVTFTRPFRLGAAPVSFEEFEAFCSATGRAPPADLGMQRGPHPAVNVSWREACDYCRWLAEVTGKPYRLPTEAEWEYAARAGSRTTRPWGPAWDATRANGAASVGHTSLPGAYPANAFGLHDMIGNVWEWCADPSHDDYRGAPSDGSVWEDRGDAGLRVIRGGSFTDLPQALRCAMRGWYGPDDRSVRIGFRVAEGG